MSIQQRMRSLVFTNSGSLLLGRRTSCFVFVPPFFNFFRSHLRTVPAAENTNNNNIVWGTLPAFTRREWGISRNPPPPVRKLVSARNLNPGHPDAKHSTTTFFFSAEVRKVQIVPNSIRSEVFRAVTMKNTIFEDVTLCGSWNNRRFGESNRLNN
jgi:hypothetical protein